MHRGQDLRHRRGQRGAHRRPLEGVPRPVRQGWRARLEEKLYRNWLAKEKLVTLSDDIFNKLIAVMADVRLQKLSVLNILKAVRDRYPEITKEFEAFL